MSDASPESLVYIAYARADVARVAPVVAALRARGLAVHFDDASAHGSGSYVHMTQQALGQARALVVFVSQASMRSPWVESEARAFQAQMARGGGRKLIPVRLDDTPLPLAFSASQAIDGASATPDALATAVATALGSATTAAPAATPAPEPLIVSASTAAPTTSASIGNTAAGAIYAAYARADIARVAPIIAALRADGWSVVFDANSMHGSGDYVSATQQALRQADALVVFVSQASMRSPWVESEARAFQAQMARGGGRKLISVRLDEMPVPSALAGYTTVDSVSASPATVAATIGHYLSAAPEAPIEATRGGAVAKEPAADEGESTRGGWSYAEEPVAPATPAPEPIAAAPTEEPARAPEAPAPPPFVNEPLITPPPPPIPITQPKGTPAPAPAGTTSEAGSASAAPAPQPAAAPAAESGAAQEQVTFTAYHPKEMQTQQWQPLIVYLSLDTPATLALVAAAAAERLAGKLDQFRAASAAQAAGLMRGASLRIVPSIPGFQFNPTYLDVKWQENVQQHEFRMRAVSADKGRAANGVVQVFQGLLLRGEIPISIFVGEAAARPDSPDAYQQAIARAYRKVFASYSHKDAPVVESCETAARTMGDNYLRDVTLLQAGVEWNPRLIQAIDEADIFQLFWSKRAAESPYVEHEWRHALELLPARARFIRPVYWTSQPYTIPPELNALHFQQLSLTSLGWGWVRRFFYGMGNG